MAAHMPRVLIETVNNIYKYLGYDDSVVNGNAVFQEPRISRQNPSKCDLCLPLGDNDASVPAVLLFPEFRTCKLKLDIEKVRNELPVVSESWLLPIKSCTVSPASLCILLDRRSSFHNTILKTLGEAQSHEQTTCRRECVFIDKDMSLKDKDSVDLTQLRTILAFESLCNLFNHLGYEVQIKAPDGDSESKSIRKFHVCYKTVCSEKQSGHTLIHCGAVLDAATRMKATSTCAKDYCSIKRNAFVKMAQGRDNSQNNDDQIKSLSEAEVAAALLWVKLHDNVSVSLTEDPDITNVARGATFLLYNHVRLSCIRKKFQVEVENGTYKELPEIGDVDFGLLTQNEEWELLLLTLQFPYWLINCVSPKGKVSLHPLLIGLDKICRLFSVYYRRVRILTEPRPQLLPVMYARLYLLQCLEHQLGLGLSIFNMKPLSYM